MKVDKKIIAMIMAMAMGTNSAFAQSSNLTRVDDLSVGYSQTENYSDDVQTGIVIKKVNLRTQPNTTTSSIIRSLKVGEKVTIVGKSGNYYKIKYDTNKYGYAYANNYIQIVEEKPPVDEPVVKPEENIKSQIGITTGNVNVRTSPSSSNSTNIAGKLLKDTKVEVVEIQGNYYKIKYQGQYAYASKSYISVKEGMKLDKIEELKLEKSVEVRELADLNSKELLTLQKGTVVAIVEKITGNWYKVEVGGGYGYIKVETTSTIKPEETPENKPSETPDNNTKPENPSNKPEEENLNTVGIATGNVNVRTSPSSANSENIAGKLLKDTKVEVVKKEGNYYKIKYEGQYAYASKSYISIDEKLKLDKIDELKLTKDVEVKDLATEESNSLSTLKQGSVVDVIENFLNGWYKVEVEGVYGYIYTEDNVKASIGTATANVNTRYEANLSATVAGVLPKGTKVEVVGLQGAFYKVKYKGEYRYVSKSYLVVDDNTKLDKIAQLKVTNNVELKELASDDSASKTKLKQGMVVNLVEKLLSGWYLVEKNNVYGYIKEQDGEIIESNKDTNLVKDGEDLYYINPDGSKFVGYKVVDGVRYYFDDTTGKSINKFVVLTEEENGKSVTNRYYIKKNGGVITNEFRTLTLTNKTYYFGEDGKAAKGIVTINNNKYYFEGKYSYAMSGLCSLDENMYFFNEETFVMETDTTKYIAGKIQLDINSDGKVYNITKLDDSNLANVIYTGFSKMGMKYSFNSSEGVDCSNFISDILSESGINVFSRNERTSQQQAIYCEENGLTIDKDDLKPGDLVFFNQTNCSIKTENGHCDRELENGMHVHHVAMYIGDGKIIESSRAANADSGNPGVRVYDLSQQSSTYYVYSAARVIQEEEDTVLPE